MSYYGYERLRPGEALGIDMAKVTDIFDKDIKEYEKTKGENRESIAKSNRDLAKLLSTMPSSFASEYNAFWAQISNEAMTKMSAVNKRFADGEITKQHHDTLVANLNSQTGLLVDGMSSYVTQENEMSKQCMPGGTMGDEDCFKWNQASLYSNLPNVTVSYDENTYQPVLILEGEDGSRKSMSVNEYFNITQAEPAGHYDVADNIDQQLQTIGLKEVRDEKGNLIKTKLITEEGEEATAAIDNAAQAMISQPWNMRGLLSSQPFTLYENGVETDYEFTREALPADIYDDGGIINKDKLKELQDKNPHVFYMDKSGQWNESEESKRVAYEYAKFRLTTAAELTKEDALKPKMSTAINLLLNTAGALNRQGLKIPEDIFQFAIETGLDMSGVDTSEFKDIDFEKIPVNLSAAQLKDIRDKANQVEIQKKINKADKWIQDNLFLLDGQELIPPEGGSFTLDQIENLVIDYGYRVGIVEETDGIGVYVGDELVYDLGENPTAKELKLLKRTILASDPTTRYSIWRINNKEEAEEGDFDWSDK